MGNDFILKAKRFRKALGGAMRQSGVLASCCLVALDEIVPIMHKDRENANYVFDEIMNMNVDGLKLCKPDTNILMFEIDDLNGFVFNDAEFVKYMTDEWDIRMTKWEKNIYRFVFHHQNEAENIEILLNS